MELPTKSPLTRSRLAPTPSGFLHLGNAYNFVLTWLKCRESKGRLLLRIDDIDAPRIRAEYIEDIFRTLDWLGLDFDEGSQSPDDLEKNFSQQLKTGRYGELLNRLIETENVFACTCSRKDIENVGFHPPECRARNLPLDTHDASLRLYTPEGSIIEFNDEASGATRIDLFKTIRDPIVRRRDDIPAYHIASLADDIDYNINLIVRGEDLLAATALHIYIARLLNEKSFPASRFYHHPLIKEDSGAKLSKSAGSSSVKHLRDTGVQPAHFYKWFSKQLGMKEEATTVAGLLESVQNKIYATRLCFDFILLIVCFKL